jgi:hypothetical protein
MDINNTYVAFALTALLLFKCLCLDQQLFENFSPRVNFARAERRTNFWLGSRPDVILQDQDYDRQVTQLE